MLMSDWSSDVCSSDLNGFTQEINTFVNQGLMTTVSAVGQHLTRSPMSAQRRDDDLRQYLQREYDAERYHRVNKRNWLTVRNTPSVKATIHAYKHTYGAKEQTSVVEGNRMAASVDESGRG